MQYRRVLFDLIFLFKILTGQSGHAIRNVDSHLYFKAPYITRGHTFKLNFPDDQYLTPRETNFITELSIIATSCRGVF